MAFNTTANELDSFVTEVVTNVPGVPVGAIVLWGYLGPASTDAIPAQTAWRLYRNLQLNEYLEINNNDDILFGLHLANTDNKFAGTVLWVKREARIKYVGRQTLEIQAEFLQGSISAGGGTGSAWTGMGGTSFACPGGGTSFACPGGGTSFACPGGGTSFACPGGGTSFACPGGGTSFACPGGGTSFACPGGGASFAGCW
jgi:hypothetical protein